MALDIYFQAEDIPPQVGVVFEQLDNHRDKVRLLPHLVGRFVEAD